MSEEVKNGATATAAAPVVAQVPPIPPVPAHEIPPAPVAPEPIEVKLPEGSKLVGTRLDDAKKIMADPKLSASQKLQGLIDAQAKWEQEDRTAATEAASKANATAVSDYRKRCEDMLAADPIFGKDRAAALAVVKRSERNPEAKALAEWGKRMGAENDPVLLRALHAMGATMAEDRTVDPAPKPAGIEDAKKRFEAQYDHPTSRVARGQSPNP